MEVSKVGKLGFCVLDVKWWGFEMHEVYIAVLIS